jgi:hypothetical protein
MKTLLFSLVAFVYLSACGLVIDADKLVEGNGAPDADAPPPDGGDATD